MYNKLENFKMRTPSLSGSDCDEKRKEILDYYLETWCLFEQLFEPLSNDDVFYKSPEPTRHPLIFYFGHTASFFINKLIVSKAITKRINADYESMFAIGVDEMSWDDMEKKHYQWPAVDEVKAYRDEVKATITELIQTQPLQLPITWDDPFWWIILMGCEHERIHIETSSVLHRQLGIADVNPHEFWPICPERAPEFPENQMVHIPGGSVSIGKELTDDFYGWDNEYGKQTTAISAFKVSKFLVSNGEFMDFVQAGGYTHKAYWSEEGWRWLQEDGRRFPHFWQRRGDEFHYRTMLELIEMPMNWPVDVNYHEAKAFCAFKSVGHAQKLRLITEPEWYYLCERNGISQNLDRGNINLSEFASSIPVDQHLFGDIYDLVGNKWQWTETTIDGFEGFAPHITYDDFSIPTFDGKHNLIKGGSWISTGNEALKSSRYAFRRHFMQHAGFRYVTSDAELDSEEVNAYESDRLVSQYCDFHYGPEHFGVKNLALSLVEIAMKYQDERKKGKAFDLGCAVGRASFQLARYFDQVTGVDFSASFIRVGTQLKEEGRISYQRDLEGSITRVEHVTLKELGYGDCASKVQFWQADACNLKPHFKDYDLVIASNLIDRLYDPRLFLRDISNRINSGGLFVISSPYTWLEEYTAKEHWLGGYTKDGVDVNTLDGLKETLSETFELINEPEDVPFIIRETARKFQHSIAQVSVWKKR